MIGNGDRDHTLGQVIAAVAKIERRLESGDQRFERLENRSKSLADSLLRIDGRIIEAGKLAGSRHAEVLGALESLRRQRGKQPSYPQFSEDDSDAITDVTDPETLRSRARKHRDQERKLKRWGAAAAPFLVGLGVALWELLKASVLK